VAFAAVPPGTNGDATIARFIQEFAKWRGDLRSSAVPQAPLRKYIIRLEIAHAPRIPTS